MGRPFLTFKTGLSHTTFKWSYYRLRTVWKFQDFSVTQILREINFGDFETLHSPTLIPRKIWVTEKFCSFHTVLRRSILLRVKWGLFLFTIFRHYKDLAANCKGLTKVDISMESPDDSFIREAIVGVIHFKDLEDALSRKHQIVINK